MKWIALWAAKVVIVWAIVAWRKRKKQQARGQKSVSGAELSQTAGRLAESQ